MSLFGVLLQQAYFRSVNSYDVSTGILAVKHQLPSSTIQTIADVDVTLVLETIKRENMEVGAWINVMGYVMEEPGQPAHQNPKTSSRCSQKMPEKHVLVQAIAVWSAGNIDLEAYEKAVQLRQHVEV